MNSSPSSSSSSWTRTPALPPSSSQPQTANAINTNKTSAGWFTFDIKTPALIPCPSYPAYYCRPLPNSHSEPKAFFSTTTTTGDRDPDSSWFKKIIKVPAMAWRSSGSSNKDLVENLWKNKLITKGEVKDAFLKVDRAHYCPSSPYEDSPQPIGHSATISAPHMHASAVEHLLPYLLPSEKNGFKPRVLDVGSGSGYLTHVMAELVGDKGKVVGIEHIKPLQELGEGNMNKSSEGRQMLQTSRVRFRVADGRKGWEDSEDGGSDGENTGWDAIHVGASAVEIHKELLDQLKSPGRMFIPVDDEGSGGWGQHVWCVDKDEGGRISRRKLFGVRYVPLTDAPKG
ncbi:protein-L-isoaspartate O-methyltransferase-domain-containing protein [Cladorrhinum sp. PSN259]|nr:protein-L-isoaspartate O-methyltransferase-domain-containing protein [Cladorrhinum sp. PSN259]